MHDKTLSRRLAKQSLWTLPVALVVALTAACGQSVTHSATINPVQPVATANATANAGATAKPISSSTTAQASGAATADASGSTAGAGSGAGSGSGSAAVPAFVCAVKKTPVEFVTSLTQDIFRRVPNATELQMAAATTFDSGSFLDWAMQQPDFTNAGIPFFVGDLFRLSTNLIPDPKQKGKDVALINDLRQEPVQLILHNLDQPWGNVFTTQDNYCTTNTAPLYGATMGSGTTGFQPCKMEAQRAGILSLVSILRGYSSAFYTNNNNYHRNALAVYMSQGIQLASATNGPKGTGAPAPLPSCVPSIDTRMDQSKAPFGTAAVPESGATCASCHVPYHAEMVGGFINFDLDGSLMTAAKVSALKTTTTLGVSPATLQTILTAGQDSCWSVAGPSTTPQNYTGAPGFAALIANSPTLATALAIQIQTNFANRTPNPTATAQTAAAFNANGKTLLSAVKGYFTSDPYTCSIAAK